MIAGADSELGSPQSKHAPGLLRLDRRFLLSDPADIRALKRHYQMVRDAVDGEAPRESAAFQAGRDTAGGPAGARSCAGSWIGGSIWPSANRILAAKMRELQERRRQKKRRAGRGRRGRGGLATSDGRFLG